VDARKRHERSADREFERRGTHPAHVFNPNDGWTWEKGNFKFYFGWRERGNFGIKLNLPFGKKS